MDEFGVTAPRLRALASRAPIPQLVLQSDITADRTWTILGAQMKTVSSPGEQSAAGLAEVRGVLVLEVPRGSIAAKSGLEANDAIVELSPDEFDAGSEPIHNAADLLGLIRARSWRAETKVIVIRNQQRVEIALKTAQE
jgi:S1-C subfamily serine protease